MSQEKWWYDDEQRVVVDITIPDGQTAAASYPVAGIHHRSHRRAVIDQIGQRIARVPEYEREIDALKTRVERLRMAARAIRKAFRIAVGDAAKAAGMTVPAYCGMENGDRE